MSYALSYLVLTVPLILGIKANISPIIFYFLMTLGDNMVYPIGNSITAKLSPKSFETQMQSAWSQSTSIANGITMILLKFFTTSDSQMTLFPIMAVVLVITSVVVFIFAGLLDCYGFAHIDCGLTIADNLGDWVYNRLSRLPHETLMKMWSLYIAGEFGGMNEAMSRLYGITGKENHLKAARLFDNDKLFLPLKQKIDALDTMHANQHIPQIIGCMKLFEVTGEKKYYDIAAFFWESVTGHHIYTIGGTGEGEMFHGADEIGRLEQRDDSGNPLHLPLYAGAHPGCPRHCIIAVRPVCAGSTDRKEGLSRFMSKFPANLRGWQEKRDKKYNITSRNGFILRN